jgi:multidrug efflux system membrane fusion protein
MPGPSSAWIRRTIVSVGVSGMLLLGSFSGFAFLASLKSKPPSRKQQTRVYQVDLYRIQAQPLQQIMTAFGTARSDHQVVLAAQVAGEIVSVHPQLRVGLRIPPQQSEAKPVVLLKIDPQAFQQKVIQASRRLDEDQAELARHAQDAANTVVLLQKARADLAEYRKEYERVRGLKQKGVATDSDVTKATLELRRYDDQVISLENRKRLLPLDEQKLLTRREVHKSDLALAQLELEHATLEAPFSGVLGEVHVEQGQYVQPGEALVRLVDDSRIEIPVSLTASDYERVRALLESGAGPLVELATEETSAAAWSGRVARLAPEVNERTRTGLAFVIVENLKQPRPLVPGTFVHARISGEQLEQAIVIPRDAISVDEQGRQFVWVVSGRSEVIESAVEGEPATETRTIERRILVDGQKSKVTTLQTMALVEAGVLEDDELIVLTNLDVLSEGSVVRLPHSKDIRTLDTELAVQRVRVLRRIESPEDAAIERSDR